MCCATLHRNRTQRYDVHTFRSRKSDWKNSLTLSWEKLAIPFKVEVDYLKQQFDAFVAESQKAVERLAGTHTAERDMVVDEFQVTRDFKKYLAFKGRGIIRALLQVLDPATSRRSMTLVNGAAACTRGAAVRAWHVRHAVDLSKQHADIGCIEPDAAIVLIPFG